MRRRLAWSISPRARTASGWKGSGSPAPRGSPLSFVPCRVSSASGDLAPLLDVEKREPEVDQPTHHPVTRVLHGPVVHRTRPVRRKWCRVGVRHSGSLSMSPTCGRSRPRLPTIRWRWASACHSGFEPGSYSLLFQISISFPVPHARDLRARLGARMPVVCGLDQVSPRPWRKT